MKNGLVLIAAFASLAGCAAFAQAPETKPGMEVQFDVPQDRHAQRVTVVTRDIPPGGQVPWHTHPGVEIAYVESGEMELWMAGQAVRRLGPGESFMASRGTVHGGRNIGDGPARLVITYVVDRDAPLRSPAPPPEGP